MLSKRYEPTEVDRRTWLHVPSGTPWSTSSDTHQVVETSTYLYTPLFNHYVCDNNTHYLQIACERDGAKLAEIESQEENDFLKSFLSKLLGDKVLHSG